MIGRIMHSQRLQRHLLPIAVRINDELNTVPFQAFISPCLCLGVRVEFMLQLEQAACLGSCVLCFGALCVRALRFCMQSTQIYLKLDKPALV